MGTDQYRCADAIWRYSQRLKAYRDAPTPRRRARLQRDFDRLFLKKAGWSELNEALRAIHGKTLELLLVLAPPEADDQRGYAA